MAENLAPWEKEELERWVSPEEQQAKLRAEEEAKRQAELEMKSRLDGMMLTTAQTLPNTKIDILGIVSDYYYWLDNDLHEDIHANAQIIEDNLITSIKMKAIGMGGDGIIGLMINKVTNPTSYTAAGPDGTVGVHFLHCLNVSVSGTVVKVKRTNPPLTAVVS